MENSKKVFVYRVLDDISIFPNPTNEYIFISSDHFPQKSEIYNLSGKLLKTNLNSSYLNIRNLTSGMYILKIYFDNYVRSFKILKD